MDQKGSLGPGRCGRAKRRTRGSSSSSPERKRQKMDLECHNGSEKRKRSASSAVASQDNKSGLGRGKRTKKRTRSASGAPEKKLKKTDPGKSKRAKRRARSASGAPEKKLKKTDLGKSKRAKRRARSASGAPEKKLKKTDLGKSKRAKRRARSASGAPEKKLKKTDLGKSKRAKRRARSASGAPEKKLKKTDLGKSKRAKRRARSASGAPEKKLKKTDLGKSKRAKKRARSASGVPTNRGCKPDVGRSMTATKSKRLASGTPENQSKKSDVGRSKMAKKRARSASSAQEIKRCKLDCSEMSSHKRELQAIHRTSTAGSVEDDEDGHLICHYGDILNARYEIVAMLGQGGYGQVVECIDHEAGGTHVAVKIAKNTNTYTRAARDEIQVLEDLNKSDPNNAYHCVQMLEWFEHHGHICIVFELLGLSTFDFMRENNCLPFSLDNIRHMAYQICTSVNFLHMNNLTHADLKPDNIVFVTSDYVEEYNPTLECHERKPRKVDIRIMDFGSAKYDHEHHDSCVGTRPYIAPEVILELGWSQPCDVWSIGCTLLEYYLGYTVFQTHDDLEHLAMMEELLGPLPKPMAKRVVSSEKKKYFFKGWLAWDKKSDVGHHISWFYKPLKDYMTCQDSDHENLFDLIEKMLEYDPAKRITLAEALEHPFFLPLKRQNGT